MTRLEHTVLQKHFNEINFYRNEADKAFKRLQDLNGTEGTGHRWCSAQANAIDLLKSGKDYMHVYNNYVTANAKVDALTDLGVTPASLNFWK